MKSTDTHNITVNQILSLAEQHHIKQARLFGSHARGDATDGSDVDLLVELEEGAGFMDIVGFKLALEELLGCNVDVVTEHSLHPTIRDKVLREARPL